VDGERVTIEEERAALLEELRAQPLAPELTDRRIVRIADVALARLTSVTVVMENLHDPHNVSAVVRSAEGFGLDEVHVVEMPNPYKPSKSVTRGAHHWVRVQRHRGLSRCLSDLTAAGFTIAAADLGPGTVPLGEVPVDGPIAIVMGSERDGLSPRAKGLVDLRFSVPMPGFTESFNVSVSAAIALYDLTRRRRRALGRPGDLSQDVVRERAFAWLEKAATRKSRGRRWRRLNR
jgi:tRNA (guanosine-2'-O-)-methyltransferase